MRMDGHGRAVGVQPSAGCEAKAKDSGIFATRCENVLQFRYDRESSLMWSSQALIMYFINARREDNGGDDDGRWKVGCGSKW